MKPTFSFTQLIFRLLGISLLIFAAFVFQKFGSQITPLFKQFLEGDVYSFDVFVTLSSFFLGVVPLVWIGTRLLILRSFESGWWYTATLPTTALLQEIAKIEKIFRMDEVLTDSVLYLSIYLCIVYLLIFVHVHWYTPVSHDNALRVGLEEQVAARGRTLRYILTGCVLLGLLMLHSEDMSTTFRMLLSPVTMLIEVLQEYFVK